MAAALEAFESWSRTSVETRVSLLLNAAKIIRERHFEFCAWLTYEVGKNWAEADADVGETIDFLEFYSREALRLAEAKTPIQLPGECNQLLYIPLGVGAVIPPWNFPFAIMAGMTAAAIVTGNTVILKPSSDSPTIAAKFVEVLEEAGMPGGVVNFCPGSGATFGNAIVEHPKTRFIAFTGSRDVGLEIHERAAKNQKGQIWIKRTVLEMGGKDSILVCADADWTRQSMAPSRPHLDSAAKMLGVFARHCRSAGLRHFCRARRAKVAKLTVGDPATNPNMGPVVNKPQWTRFSATSKQARRKAGSCRRQGRENADGGLLHSSPQSLPISLQNAVIAQEEIFGPVLAMIKVADFEEGLKVANNTEYGLTGAFYSGSREALETARREFHVGNLYLTANAPAQWWVRIPLADSI